MVTGSRSGKKALAAMIGRPLYGEQSCPIGVREKYQQTAIAIPSEPKGQRCGTDSVEEAGSGLGLKADEGQREQAGGERILLERRVVWILPGEQAVRKVESPAEIGGILMKMFHQEPAEDAAGQAYGGRNHDTQLHESSSEH
jgi:hypothetical protein